MWTAKQNWLEVDDFIFFAWASHFHRLSVKFLAALYSFSDVRHFFFIILPNEKPIRYHRLTFFVVGRGLTGDCDALIGRQMLKQMPPKQNKKREIRDFYMYVETVTGQQQLSCSKNHLMERDEHRHNCCCILDCCHVLLLLLFTTRSLEKVLPGIIRDKSLRMPSQWNHTNDHTEKICANVFRIPRWRDGAQEEIHTAFGLFIFIFYIIWLFFVLPPHLTVFSFLHRLSLSPSLNGKTRRRRKGRGGLH